MAIDFKRLAKTKPFASEDLIPFGKYKNQPWSFLVQEQPDYIIWCVGNTDYTFTNELLVEAIKAKYAKKNTPLSPDVYESRAEQANVAVSQQEEQLYEDIDDVPF